MAELRHGVSVIIPTYNRLADLGRTVNAVFAQTVPGELLEIILVDNSSTDGTEEWALRLAENDRRFRYLRKDPEGPSAARNAGITRAGCEYALFLDSDVELSPTWIATAIAAMERDRRLGCVGGQVLYAQARGQLNAFGGELGPIGIAWDYAEGAAVSAAAQDRECLWMNCSAMMVRTEEIRQLGAFDDTFFYGYEDCDLGWRYNLSGHKVAVLSDLVAVHHVETVVGPCDPAILFHYTKNRIRSVLKNYEWFHAITFGPITMAITLVDAVARAPRKSKLRAVLWNLLHLPDTLRVRRAAQAHRAAPDREFRRLFARAWFPPTRLAGARRRPLAGIKVEMQPGSSLSDDRVH